jgi:uncharacterized membrane protein YphA (DoxX/SURF4 family)
MGVRRLSKGSLRDISGNLVPIAILVFFVAWFMVDRPWGWDLLSIVIVYGLLIVLGATLFVVTYATALVIEETDPDR